MTERERSRREGGALVLVGTPIGNLGDLGARALDVLAPRRRDRVRGHAPHAPPVDPRGHLGARAGCARCPRTTRPRASTASSTLVAGGARVAFVTDAGMPGDQRSGRAPRACLPGRRPAVEIVPGPRRGHHRARALRPARRTGSCSRGSCPARAGPRAERLAAIAAEPRTVVLYESPRRVLATLRDLEATCGPDRPAALARELTKVHEEVRRGSLASLRTALADREPRGECVIVVGGAVDEPVPASDSGARRRAGARSSRPARRRGMPPMR